MPQARLQRESLNGASARDLVQLDDLPGAVVAHQEVHARDGVLEPAGPWQHVNLVRPVGCAELVDRRASVRPQVQRLRDAEDLPGCLARAPSRAG